MNHAEYDALVEALDERYREDKTILDRAYELAGRLRVAVSHEETETAATVSKVDAVVDAVVGKQDRIPAHLSIAGAVRAAVGMIQEETFTSRDVARIVREHYPNPASDNAISGAMSQMKDKRQIVVVTPKNGVTPMVYRRAKAYQFAPARTARAASASN